MEGTIPRAFLHFERSDKRDPLADPPCDLIVNEPGWQDVFEYWYVDENYALIDDEGNRYALRWSLEENRMLTEVIEKSDEIKSIFYRRLDAWIEALPRRLKERLNVADAVRDEQYLDRLLDDIEAIKRLSKGR